jgi:hypothetical protein
MLDPLYPNLGNLVIMTLGLVGEGGEVADFVYQWDDTGVRPDADLLKETGDVFFYWARICWERDFELPSSLAIPVVASNAATPPLRAALRLTRAVGKVAEVVKKFNRDGAFNAPKFEAAMVEAYVAWRALVDELGFTRQEVLEASVNKVEGRVARGTLRGSGDSR